MPPAKPSLDLLRSMTDEQVLRLLMAEGRLTRAEIAARTGISKTTISESMRRLGDLEMVLDTGERTSGRGRAGSYYALSPDCGVALVTSISPAGVVAEAVDAGGSAVAREEVALDRAAGEQRAAEALSAAVAGVHDRVGGVVHGCVVSAADPVDRSTGRLVQLPDAPFLVGSLDPVAVLEPLRVGPVQVDNDVNWAARAERDAAPAAGLDDFVYVHLGEGLGCAVVSDGEVRRGHAGVAGEIAHVVTRGVDGAAVPFTQVFADLGLRRRSSTAVDLDAVAALLADDADGLERLGTLADAVSGVLLAAVAFTDPQVVVCGGTWGRHPRLVEALAERAAAWPRPIPVQASSVAETPDMVGARAQAVEVLRGAIVSTARER